MTVLLCVDSGPWHWVPGCYMVWGCAKCGLWERQGLDLRGAETVQCPGRGGGQPLLGFGGRIDGSHESKVRADGGIGWGSQGIAEDERFVCRQDLARVAGLTADDTFAEPAKMRAGSELSNFVIILRWVYMNYTGNACAELDRTRC
jgi:hypothetical protein